MRYLAEIAWAPDAILGNTACAGGRMDPTGWQSVLAQAKPPAKSCSASTVRAE
jgi:hypothetical protein